MSAIMRVPLLMVLITLLAPAYTLAQPPSPTSEPPPRGSFLGLQQAIELGLDHHPLVQEAGATLKPANARTGPGAVHYYPRVGCELRYDGRGKKGQPSLSGRRIPRSAQSQSICRRRFGQPADF